MPRLNREVTPQRPTSPNAGTVEQIRPDPDHIGTLQIITILYAFFMFWAVVFGSLSASHLPTRRGKPARPP